MQVGSSTCILTLFLSVTRCGKIEQCKTRMNLEAFHFDSLKRQYNYQYSIDSSVLVVTIYYTRVINTLHNWLVLKMVYFINFYISKRYYYKIRDNLLYIPINDSNMVSNLHYMEYMSISNLYDLKSRLYGIEPSLYGVVMLLYLYLLYSYRLYFDYTRIPVQQVLTLNQLKLCLPLQKQCHQLLVNSIIDPTNHSILLTLLNSIKQQIEPDLSFTLSKEYQFQSCLAELNNHPIIIQSKGHMHQNIENQENLQKTDYIGNVYKSESKANKPNHVAFLYSLQEDLSLQSKLALELQNKLT